MNQRLLDAATAGDTATLLRALEAGASPEAADTSGATALMLATQSGRLNAVRTLVEAGADSQRKGVLWLNDEHTSYYGNVTSVAAGEGHTDVLAYLLDDLGIPVDDRERDPATGDDTGWTALQWAASAGQTEAVTVLVERGAVVDRAGDTLLLLAIRNGHATTAEMLLEVGAPVADASPDGMTALHWAAARLPATWVGMLLARGADVNATSSQGRTPLQVAALVGDVTFARLLVCEGATGAEAAQALAQERGHEAVVTVLGEVALEGSPDGAACAEGRAGALNQRVVALHGAGRYAEAVPLAREALAILEAALGPDHPDVALSLNNLAFLLRATGDYAGARPLLERALAIRETALGPGHPRVATSLNNLAGLLEATGDYAGARPLYERALAILEAALGPDHPDVATSLNNLALLLTATGDYAGARPLYERALRVKEGALGPDHPDVALSLNNLAVLLNTTGDYAAARPLYERALAIRETALGPDHPDVAESLNSLSWALHLADSTAVALPLAERSVAIFEAATIDEVVVEPTHYVSALDTRARIHHALGDTTAALQDLDEALSLLEQPRALAGGEQERARFLQQFDGFYTTLFAWNLEAKDLDAALDASERGRTRTLRDQLAAGQVDLRADIPSDILAPLEAAERTLTARIAALRAQLDATRERTDLTDETRVATVEALTDSLRDAQAAFAANDAAIKGVSPTWRSYLTAEGDEVDLRTIQRQLVPRGGHLLYYVAGEDASHLLVIPDGRASPAVFALAVPDSLAAVLGTEPGALSSDALTALLDTPADTTQTGLLATLGTRSRVLSTRPEGPLPAERLAALRHVLVPDAAWALIAEAPEVVIVPDGALHRLPFEALVTTSGADANAPRYWLDEGPMIRYAPSATVLYNLTRRSAPRTVPRFDAPLVLSLSDPLFKPSEVAEALAQGGTSEAATDAADTGSLALLSGATRDAYERAGGSLARLPGTADETVAIRRAFGEAADRAVVRLHQAEAREPAVRDAVAGKRYLHFGTHGLVDEHSGHLFAALALAPPPEASTTDDDGLLELHELYALPMDEAELAVLSACATNVGPQVGGEGVFALSRGFLAAGADRVVASQWAVDDASTAALMGAFFEIVVAEEQAGRGVDYVQALWQARQAVRADERWTSPYHWAPFVLIGRG